MGAHVAISYHSATFEATLHSNILEKGEPRNKPTVYHRDKEAMTLGYPK